MSAPLPERIEANERTDGRGSPSYELRDPADGDALIAESWDGPCADELCRRWNAHAALVAAAEALVRIETEARDIGHGRKIRACGYCGTGNACAPGCPVEMARKALEAAKVRP